MESTAYEVQKKKGYLIETTLSISSCVLDVIVVSKKEEREERIALFKQNTGRYK